MACLFALYFVTFKFGSVITDEVTPVAKFKSASSRTKILRLIFISVKFEAKFANLTRRDPHLENVKFDSSLRRFAQAKQCRHL